MRRGTADSAEFQDCERTLANAQSFHGSPVVAGDLLRSEPALSGDLGSCRFPFFLNQFFLGCRFNQIVPILRLLFLFH
jgi:hypothetical protein